MNSKRRLTLRISAICVGIALGALAILSLVGVSHTVRAQSPAAEKVIYNFRPGTGYNPTGVVGDAAGNFYVATNNGVGGNQECPKGCGSILKVSASGQATLLYSFVQVLRGLNLGPSVLTIDTKGVLYGATLYGGHYDKGSAVKLAPSGVAKTFYNFGGPSGNSPTSGFTIDSAGNLYGITLSGGTGTVCTGGIGCGVIYKLTASGSETTLYSFTGGADGSSPEGGPVILDAAGNLYGTTSEGGDCPLFCGTAWKLDTSGNLTVLHSFTGGADGGASVAGMVMDPLGNLYGTTAFGGDLSCYPPYGCGVLFEINSSGEFSVLHTFTGGSTDGQFPYAALLRDSSGNLYGTTEGGGNLSCGDDGLGCGAVFKLDSSGNETILHFFARGTADGQYPASALISDGKGNLYGVTPEGGTLNGGILFAVRAQ